jgi:hypothetical protein
VAARIVFGMRNDSQESIRELRDEALEALKDQDYATVKEKLKTMDQYFDVAPSPFEAPPDSA